VTSFCWVGKKVEIIRARQDGGRGMVFFIVGGGGGGAQSRPLVLGTLIYEGV